MHDSGGNVLGIKMKYRRKENLIRNEERSQLYLHFTDFWKSDSVLERHTLDKRWSFMF